MSRVEFSRRTFLYTLIAAWACRQDQPPAAPRQPVPPPATPGLPTAGADRIAEVEWQILFVTNQQRIWRKLPPFEASAPLADVARAHSRDMLARGFFDHVNPEGLTPKDRVARHGLRFALVAENIYSTRNGTMDAGELASLLVDGWMKHEGHRRNILEPSLRFLGVGVAMSDTEVLATQLFGG